MSLADKLRSARKIEVKIGDATFTGSRATPEQFSRYANNSTTDADVCRMHIDGWSGVKESDLLEGGSDEDVKFNREDFSEVIGEKIEWYKPLAAEIIKNAMDRFTNRAENEKK